MTDHLDRDDLETEVEDACQDVVTYGHGGESHCRLPFGHQGVHRSEDGLSAWSDETHFGFDEEDFE